MSNHCLQAGRVEELESTDPRAEERETLFEAFQAERYGPHGIPARFAQDSVSRSRHGVLRGLHFQWPNAQGKLVYVLLGEVFPIDQVELDNVLGLRWNVWTSIILFVAAAVYFVVSLRRNPGRETNLYRDDRYDEPDEAEPGTDATDESNNEDEQDAADPTSRDPSPDREPTDEEATPANGSDNGSPDGKVGA